MSTTTHSWRRSNKTQLFWKNKNKNKKNLSNPLIWWQYQPVSDLAITAHTVIIICLRNISAGLLGCSSVTTSRAAPLSLPTASSTDSTFYSISHMCLNMQHELFIYRFFPKRILRQIICRFSVFKSLKYWSSPPASPTFVTYTFPLLSSLRCSFQLDKG